MHAHRHILAVAVAACCITACCGCGQDAPDWLARLMGRRDPNRPERPAITGGPMGPGAAGSAPRIDPLPVQQAKAYPETVTGLFASLADFEDVPGGPRGFQQAAAFDFHPPSPDAEREFVVNVTRTGVGALEVTLPAGCELVFRIQDVHDFTGYKVLSMALHSRALRDDATVRLVTDGASWQSGRALLRPGWNTVQFDIRRLADVPGVELAGVRELRLSFTDAAGPVWFHLDDIMVIDNARTLRPSPPGVTLHKAGLDYAIHLPGERRPTLLKQGDDGLWRLNDPRMELRLAAPGEPPPERGERVELMGSRRIGQVELLEHNAVRVRLAATWYFPSRAGQWASMAVRRVRWEYTFYADGRRVVEVRLNNAGGAEIASAELALDRAAAWAGGGVDTANVLRDFPGQVGRWRFMVPPAGDEAERIADAYLRPGRLRATLADPDARAAGDADRDGFDESRGCYVLGSRAGHCRFTIDPPAGGLIRPAFRVLGRWQGRVAVSSEGRAVRDVVRLEDGSALFVLPGRVMRPTAVEVTAAAPPVAR